MSNLLEYRNDGSVALYINGDLQFDSKDEQIYHESLTAPALSVLAKRKKTSLKALIIGGGDGLVARDLFKSAPISSIDLVDYDPQILSFAKTELAIINNNSLQDARLNLHVRDAWQFAEEAVEKQLRFDIIISDLTVAEDLAGARFHSIDWYKKLADLLTAEGILAVNAVSPSATPEAYWSIFNSILKGGLYPRPYHVHIPSFTDSGFGQTWGRFIASAKSISIDELDSETDELKQLFVFPQELFAFQNTSLPAVSDSDILLHYFANASVCSTSGETLSSFSLDFPSLSIPEADNGKKILPPELRVALAKSISSELEADPQVILGDVLQLMPSLQKDHTPEIIADFIEDPAHFLEAIDLPGLVGRLLRRAKELPAQVVAELELLRDKLQEWAGDHLSLLSLGKRVVTILTLVIVVGNLLYPDAVYGKGHAGHNAGHGVHGAGWNGTSYNTTYWRRPRVIDKTYTTRTTRTKNVAPQMKAPATTGMIQPDDSNAVLISYLSKVVSGEQATHDRLQKNREDLTTYSTMLKRELISLESSDKALVSYGSHEIPKAEAVRRTQLTLKITLSKIDSLTKDIDQLPAHIELARIALANLNQGDNS